MKGVCIVCGLDWPCDASRALVALDAAEQERDEAKSQVAELDTRRVALDNAVRQLRVMAWGIEEYADNVLGFAPTPLTAKLQADAVAAYHAEFVHAALSYLNHSPHCAFRTLQECDCGLAALLASPKEGIE